MLVAFEFTVFAQPPEANNCDLVCVDKFVVFLGHSGIGFLFDIREIVFVLDLFNPFRNKRDRFLQFGGKKW